MAHTHILQRGLIGGPRAGHILPPFAVPICQLERVITVPAGPDSCRTAYYVLRKYRQPDVTYYAYYHDSITDPIEYIFTSWGATTVDTVDGSVDRWAY